MRPQARHGSAAVPGHVRARRPVRRLPCLCVRRHRRPAARRLRPCRLPSAGRLRAARIPGHRRRTSPNPVPSAYRRTTAPHRPSAAARCPHPHRTAAPRSPARHAAGDPPPAEPLPQWTPTRLNTRHLSALRLSELLLTDRSTAQNGIAPVVSNGFVLSMPTIFERFLATGPRVMPVVQSFRGHDI